MTQQELRTLKEYCQYIINHPRPIDDQPHTRSGDKMWCEDWETIEILKYMFNGPEMYMLDPPPNRLKNNTLWNKADIATRAEAILQEYKTADEVIAYLRGRTNGA